MPGVQGIPVLGSWQRGGLTANAGTAIAALIPPYPGPQNAAPYLYNALANYVPLTGSTLVPTKANWLQAPKFGITKMTSLQVFGSSTAHTIYVCRPLNWTYFPAGLAKNTTVIPDSTATGILDDPGVYSTNYRYPTAGGVAPSQVADAAISSTNKYVAYQLSDGTWQLDTIASGTFGASLTLTTGTPNRTTGTIPTGGPLFYFGAATLSDPATGVAQWSVGTTGTAGFQNLQDYLVSEFSARWPGDPLFIFDANATGADIINASGYYGSY